MFNWTPETWGDFSVVGIVVVMGFILFWALITEKLVIGRYHREIVDRLYTRADKDAESIRILSEAVTEKNAEDVAVTRVLSALRESITTSGDR